MERWKIHDPSLRLGDSEEDAIVLSDDEEGEVEEAGEVEGGGVRASQGNACCEEEVFRGAY